MKTAKIVAIVSASVVIAGTVTLSGSSPFLKDKTATAAAISIERKAKMGYIKKNRKVISGSLPKAKTIGKAIKYITMETIGEVDIKAKISLKTFLSINLSISPRCNLVEILAPITLP